MATVKIKFRASASETKEGTLFYQVIHNRVARQIHIGYKLYPQEWDAENKEIIFPSDTGEARRSYLVSLKTAVQEDTKRLRSIVSHLDRSGNTYTAEEVVAKYRSPTDNHCFLSFSRNLVGQLKQIGKQCTADTYTTAINSFARFRNERDVPLDDVDSDLMTAYETYLKANGICPNSISFYMRNLRAIYNRAVDKELTVQRYPFKHVYTGIDKTVKRAIAAQAIRRIRDLDLGNNPSMDYARDMFMFSFYTRGMSFIDMAYLRKSDLSNGILSYRRQKTKQLLTIRWETQMQEIVGKYHTEESPYLLPIIKDADADIRKQYRNAAHLVNDKLKKIGKRLGIDTPLTTYVARHTWASIAKNSRIPISVICEGLGHDSEKTTEIYLASLDSSVIDEANKIIIGSL